MRIETTILRSKVARRIFLLFVTCAMLPIVVLTVISSRMMTTHLEEQSRLRLRQASKSVGMVLLGRLSMAESELRALAWVAELDRGALDRAPSQPMSEHLQARIRGVALVSQSGIEHWFGETVPASDLAIADGSMDWGGDARLELLDEEEGPTRTMLGLAIDADHGRSVILVAEIDPDYLWNVDDEIDLQAGADLFVLGADERLLFTSLDSPSVAILNAQTPPARGEFRWSLDGREQRGHSWSMFLEPQFGCPSWIIATTEPAGGVVDSLAWASKILPLVILLCLLVVAMLSLIQIRKSLIPIVSLQEGTKRVAESNFDVRVTVNSNDEFAQLAESFNAMADRLGKQFRTLMTMADIDRELLSTLREEQIVETLLLRAPDRFGCDRAAVTLVSADQPDTVSTRARCGVTGIEEASAVLSDEGRRRLFAGAEETISLPGDALPPHLADALGGGLAECLIVPIRKKSVTGCLSLGFVHAGSRTDEELSEALRLADQAGVALSNARLVEELERVNWQTLYALARAVDANSSWTAGHSERVTRLSLELARRLDVSEEELVVLHRGGLLHDVGKIGVPGYILNKPDRLTPEEFALMRDHVRIGARIMEPISGYRREIPIILYHHERFDGSGYPDGLAGERIPHLARILTVADVFDALSSDRPYRAGWELPRVIDFMGEQAGAHFDPAVVKVFLELVDGGTLHEYLSRGETCLIPEVEALEQRPVTRC